MGGVTFGTSTYQTHGNVTGITIDGKEKKGEIAPVKGSMIGKNDESMYNFTCSYVQNTYISTSTGL
jgi:hypothetical protein